MLRLRHAVPVVLAALAAACTVGTDVTTTDGAPPDNGTTAPDNGATTTTAEPSPTLTAPDLSGLEGLSSEVRSQLEELIVAAQEIRELPFLSEPQIIVVSEEELGSRVLAMLEEQFEDLPADAALYRLLGLIGEDDDLEGLLLDLYDEQVGGFYDGETGEVVVPGRPDGFSLVQQGTLVHELVHAIADQHFGFAQTLEQMLDEQRYDEATAYRALIEGDAVLAEVFWVQELSPRQLGEFVAEALAIDDQALAAAPQFIQETLLFPYDRGLAFVQQLHSAGGWDAVNEAYRGMPELPGSTEQIIIPGEYGRDLPAEVELPEITIDGYQLEVSSVWGKLGFQVMLGQVLGDPVAASAAAGWGGDAYHQWFDGENAAFLLVYVGDTPEDLEEMRTALVDYVSAAVDPADFASVEISGGRLYFIAAHEPEVGEQIRSEVGLGQTG